MHEFPRKATTAGPGYPSRRDHLERKALLGAIAVGAVTLAAGCVTRTRGVTSQTTPTTAGVPPAEPRAEVMAVGPQTEETVVNEDIVAVGLLPVAPNVTPPGRDAQVRTHVVGAGDTLYALAQSYLGDGRRWPEIAALNPGLIPEKLRAGDTIRLPSAP